MSKNTKMLNVGLRENQTDQFHRWKMPELETEKTGRGKNTKTHIRNVEEVATCIGRSCDPRFLMKFLSVECNTSTKDDFLKGLHDRDRLQDKVFDYIEHFALCPDCGKPRIKLFASKQKKSHKIGYKCGACGNRGVLKGKHKKSGKMFKFMSQILKTDKRLNPERVEYTKSGEPEEVVFSNADFEEEEVATGADYGKWVSDADLSRTQLEREREASSPLNEEHIQVVQSTPRELLRKVLNDPNETLLSRVSEFERMLTARQIDDELKIARIVVDSSLDFSSEQKLLDTIQRYGVFLSWFCQDRERALMIISITSNLILNNGLLSRASEIFERMYDSQILSPMILLHWNSLPAEQCYILNDPNDVHDVKEKTEPFISWLQDAYAEKV